jgi:GNAT superfamily N-acetyltransferase
MKTLELATDLLVMGDRSRLEEFDDRIVQRTPDEPDFWFGNRTIFRETGKIEEQIARAQADFPAQAFSTISWDIPDLDPGPFKAALEAAGYEVEQGQTLVGFQAARPGLPDGITFRKIGSDAEWEAVILLQTESLIGEGYDPNAISSFVRARFAERQKDSAAGRGGWFGLFEGALLVADMGLVWSGDLVRYQSVETRASHRRRGLCSALLGEVSAFAAKRFPKARQVIVADAGSAAARLYEGAGFVPAERVLSAVKRPETETNPA